MSGRNGRGLGQGRRLLVALLVSLWWGLSLIALSAGAWWALPGPLLMTLLLSGVCGKDHLERSMFRRPGYAAYVERTSGVVPLPPRGASR